jgi:parvulin-like peptidyl-prolyl isomerase
VIRRRRAALFVAGPLAAVTLLATGCESRAGAAAIIGDQRVTDDRLQSLVSEALAAPGVRDALPNTDYKGDLAAYSRAVLNSEVTRVLAVQAAGRLGITVNDSDVNARFHFYESTLGGPAQFPAELASRAALSPQLFLQTVVPGEVALADIGYQVGGVARPTETELRSQYEPYAKSMEKATLSLIPVPDEATMKSVATRLRQEPGSFDAVAKQYVSAADAAPRELVVSQLPPDLLPLLTAAKVGEMVPYAASDPSTGQSAFYVIRYGGIKRPSFDEAAPALLNTSFQAAVSAAQKHITKLAGEIGVQINPRYGSWDAAKGSIADFVNPVIKTAPTPAPTPAAPGQEGLPDSGAPNPSQPGG